MENQEEIFRIDIDERMKDFGASGMLLSLNLPDIVERDMKNFYIIGGMVICLCRRYEHIQLLKVYSCDADLRQQVR